MKPPRQRFGGSRGRRDGESHQENTHGCERAASDAHRPVLRLLAVLLLLLLEGAWYFLCACFSQRWRLERFLSLWHAFTARASFSARTSAAVLCFGGGGTTLPGPENVALPDGPKIDG
jgi:hypothetical protein